MSGAKTPQTGAKKWALNKTIKYRNILKHPNKKTDAKIIYSKEPKELITNILKALK